MDHRDFIELALADQVLSESWSGTASWHELVSFASRETENSSRPFSAVLWEALWRVDPALAHRWMTHGPKRLGPELGSPNPYLQHATVPAQEWIEQVSDVDVEAAGLLATAVRAELVEHWWDPEAVLRQYAWEWRAYMNREDQALAQVEGDLINRERPEGFASFETEPLVALEAGDDLEKVEQALTRLVLIGHRPTTVYVLPELLTFASVEAGSSVLESQELRTALLRFPATQRVQVAAGIVLGLSPTRLMRRERPPEVKEFLFDASGRKLQASVAVLVAGGFLWPLARKRWSASSRRKESEPIE